jgi:hypothetical protein
LSCTYAFAGSCASSPPMSSACSCPHSRSRRDVRLPESVVVRQGLSGLLIGLQRVGLPAGPVEGHHQVQPKMIKPGRVGQDPRIGGEPVQRRATPQTECRAQRSRSRLVAAPSLPAARAVRTAVRPRRRPESLGIAGSLPAHLFPADGLSEPGNLDSAAQLLDHFGEVIIGCLRSKNSVSPTLSLFISSMLACNSGGSSLRSPSRASASEMKYITMV